MKRTALALILALLLAIVGTNSLDMCVAQFDIPPPPLNPDPNPPSIEVLSPIQNQTYNSSSVWLNFTVTKPDTWVGDVGKSYGWTGEGHSGLGYIYWGKITFIWYYLDGKESERVSANDPAWYNTVLQAPYYKTLDFSFNLTELSDGSHSIIVRAEGESIYGDRKTANVVGTSEVVNFTTNTLLKTPDEENPILPAAEPFPTAFGVAASVAAVVVVGAGLLVYHKKRQRGQSS